MTYFQDLRPIVTGGQLIQQLLFAHALRSSTIAAAEWMLVPV